MSNPYEQNRLFQQYNNVTMGRYNNPLVQNNPQMTDPTYQAQMMQRMNMMKQQQLMRQMERMKEINIKDVDPNVLKKAVLSKKSDTEESKFVKYKNKEMDVIDAYESAQKDYTPDRDELWKGRTNQPYKVIMNKESFKKEYKKPEELVVHRVTEKDKDEQKLDTEYKSFKGNIVKHNDELEKIYSTSKKMEYKKKFEYNQHYNTREKFDPNDHNKLKHDQLERYKMDQMKLEKNKKKMDNIIESLVSGGVLTEDEVKSHLS